MRVKVSCSLLLLLAAVSLLRHATAINYGDVPGNDRQQKYPWTVKVYKNHEPYCTGSIIASNKILTAAHCTSREDPPSEYGIYTMDDTYYQVKMNILHPNFSYSDSQRRNDVTVLILDRRIVYSLRALKIRLSFDHVLPEWITKKPTEIVYTGFGPDESIQNDKYGTLRVGAGSMKYYTMSGYTYISLCFHHQKAVGGDSGGPGVLCGKSKTDTPRPCIQIGVISMTIPFCIFFAPMDMYENFINTYVPMIASLPE